MSIIHILGESAVRSLALALAVALVLRVLRVEHAHLAKRAWTAVLILALVMPALVVLHIPSFSFLALWSTPRTVILPGRPAVSAQDTLALDTLARSSRDNSAFTVIPKQPALLAPSVTARVPVPAALEGPPQTAFGPGRHLALWQIGFAAYLAITTLLLLRVFLGLSLAVRLWRRAQPFATEETDLPVRLSLRLRSPATVGHGILLPLEAIGWDDAALRATLAHEEKHIREGDFYLQLAATLHHCFFWISPHAWWLRPQLSRLSETICDRAAIASSGDGLGYAQLLVRFATAERTPEGMLAMAQSAGLRERIERLITDPQLSGAFRHRRGQAIAAGALLATVAIVAAASVHIIQPATIVLAAPQAPAPPPLPTAPAASAPQAPPAPDASPDAAPAPAPPMGGPVSAPAPPAPPMAAPAPAPGMVPPAAPPAFDTDVHIGSGTGVGVGEGIGLGSSDRPVIQVHPEIHLKTHVVSRDGDKVLVVQGVGPVSPVMD
ncbi:MAG TPA: M56 family metallopeptidase, partial [Acidobacteriaceae bacterium]